MGGRILLPVLLAAAAAAVFPLESSRTAGLCQLKVKVLSTMVVRIVVKVLMLMLVLVILNAELEIWLV